MKVKQIEWSEEKEPNEVIRYNHVIGKTPLGNFIIDWKGWKESPSYNLEHEHTGYIFSLCSLEYAKEEAQRKFNEAVLSCLVQTEERQV